MTRVIGADLIERLESATEGSRELSDDILRAVGWDKAGGGWRNPHGQYVPFAPDPSRSIDAALTLVPEGWWWEVFGCHLTRTNRASAGMAPRLWIDEWTPEDEGGTESKAATPALALCAAALKAREMRN